MLEHCCGDLLSFTPLQPTLGIVHGDLRLVCSCSATETHFMKLLTNSFCADVASRGSFEHGSECCNWGQTIFMHFSTWRFSSVSLCGLPLCGWAFVAPIHFHFTIAALTVEGGRADILQTDLLERHSMTAILKVTKLFSKDILLQMSDYRVRGCAGFYTPVSNGCGWNGRIHSF